MMSIPFDGHSHSELALGLPMGSGQRQDRGQARCLGVRLSAVLVLHFLS